MPHLFSALQTLIAARLSHFLAATRRLRYLPCLLITATLLLGSCSNLPTLEVTEQSKLDWIANAKQLDKIDHWDIRGRAVIFVGDQTNHIGIRWKRDQEHFSIVVEAPFGQGVIRVETTNSVDQNSAFKLNLPDGQIKYGPTAESLLTELLGWSIPVNGLKSWIKGQPHRQSAHSYLLNGDGRLRTLKQDNWKINYLDYFTADDEHLGLPKKIYMKHPTLALKIVIDHWNPVPQPDESTPLFPVFD